MGQFKNAHESHEHSLETLDILYGYDSFLDSLEIVTDMGCGRGLDTNWWATLETRDDPPEPRNLLCYAVDKNIQSIDQSILELENVRAIECDFENYKLPRKSDLIWCHDSFQHAINPLQTLAHWHSQMNVDGMLVIILKQNIAYEYNRLVHRGYNYQFYNYNLINLIYMLAVSGFDCRDAYVKKEENNPWLHVAVYKTDNAPMNPATTSWFDLADKNLLHDSILESLNKYSYVRQEDFVYPWLDKDFYRVRT
jgi:hypothetical protein